MISLPALQSVLASTASTGGGRLINCVIEGMLVALLACALLRLCRCRNSGTRFAVWFSALLAIAALSTISFAIRGANGAGNSASKITLPFSWLLYAFLIWAAIAAYGLMRLAVCSWHVWSLRRHSRVLTDDEIDPVLRRTLADFGSLRRVKLCVCEDLRVPAAVGFFRPAVVMPRWALEELSATELNAVLLHELGHLSRWDDWSNLAQKLLRAVLFFHPAVWWIDSRLTLEREMACDDLVLAKTSDPRSYAQCLVSVAEKSLLRTGLALALAAVSRMRQTATRLSRILDPNRVLETRVSKPPLAGMSVIALAALMALPHTPTLVVFQNGTNFAGDRVENIAEAGSFAPAAHILKSGREVSATYAHVVPAAFQMPAAAKSAPTGNPVLGRDFRPAQRLIGLRQIKTKAEGGRNQMIMGASESSVHPRVVKAALRTSKNVTRDTRENHVHNPEFVFVVQTEEFDATSMPVWSVRVLRLTFMPNQSQVQSLNGTIASSI